MQNSILEYYKYTSFLQKFYKSKKKDTPSWSYHVWSNKMNISDTGLLNKVVAGTRSPNKEVQDALAKYFNFSTLEYMYWNFLIETHKLNLSDSSKEILLESLKRQLLNSTGPGCEISILPEGIQWLHGAILILLSEYDEINLSNIDQYFCASIDKSEFFEAITELLDANILYVNKDSNLELTTSIHSIYADNTNSTHYEQTQVTTCKSFIDAAAAHMFTVETPVGGHLSQNMFISIDPNDISEFTKDLRTAVVDVMMKYEKNEGNRLLYNVLLQGYKVTRPSS